MAAVPDAERVRAAMALVEAAVRGVKAGHGIAVPGSRSMDILASQAAGCRSGPATSGLPFAAAAAAAAEPVVPGVEGCGWRGAGGEVRSFTDAGGRGWSPGREVFVLEMKVCDSELDQYGADNNVVYGWHCEHAPTTKEYVDSKYLAVVADVADIPKFNWGQFTLTNLLSCINEYIQFNLPFPQGNLVLLQFWYWEHVIPKPPPVLMARWDEGNTRLRTEHFHKEGLDGGEVIMNISEVNGLPRP